MLHGQCLAMKALSHVLCTKYTYRNQFFPLPLHLMQFAQHQIFVSTFSCDWFLQENLLAIWYYRKTLIITRKTTKAEVSFPHLFTVRAAERRKAVPLGALRLEWWKGISGYPFNIQPNLSFCEKMTDKEKKEGKMDISQASVCLFLECFPHLPLFVHQDLYLNSLVLNCRISSEVI